jgi:DNA-binding transcriptional regulator YhcF (GntR family)
LRTKKIGFNPYISHIQNKKTDMREKLYETITNSIMESIDCGELRPGDRIPSADELRERFNVSHITALRVYRELSAKNYILSKRGRGYFVSSRRDTAAAQFTGRVGNFLRPLRPPSPIDNYFNLVNYAVHNECCKLHLSLLGSHTVMPLDHFRCSDADLRGIMDAMTEMAPEVSGFIVDERVPDEALEPALGKINKPIVIVNRPSALPVTTVTPPNREGTLKILDAVRRCGFDRYIFCDTGRGLGNELERRAAFDEFIRVRGIKKEFTGLIRGCGVLPPETVLRELEAAIDSLPETEGRVLLFTPSDYYGRVFADFIQRKDGGFSKTGVVSFGGIDIGLNKSPRLATVLSNPEQIGRIAARRLHEMMETPMSRENRNYSSDVVFDLGETV